MLRSTLKVGLIGWEKNRLAKNRLIFDQICVQLRKWCGKNKTK